MEGALYREMLFLLDYFKKDINNDIFYGEYKYKLSLRLHNEYSHCTIKELYFG